MNNPLLDSGQLQLLSSLPDVLSTLKLFPTLPPGTLAESYPQETVRQGLPNWAGWVIGVPEEYGGFG